MDTRSYDGFSGINGSGGPVALSGISGIFLPLILINYIL
jgi:hypothetical protein